MDSFPSNSQRAKSPPREEPQPQIAAKDRKVERVVEGEVIRRKRPMSKRLREIFVPEDAPSVRDHVVHGIIAPYFRDMFVDAVTSTAERMAYGESSVRNRRMGRPGSLPAHVAYNAFASRPVGKTNGAREDPRPALSRQARAMHDFQEILLPSRQDANIVLQGLYDILEQYNEVSVRDLYELCGVSSNFPDFQWGWDNLMGSSVRSARNGYFVLDLPQPKYLEK